MFDFSTDLPYGSVHKFVATIGFFLVVLGLFVEPVRLDSGQILSVGVVGVGSGMAGWVFESMALPYDEILEEKNITDRKKRRRKKRFIQFSMFLRVALPVLFILAIVAVLF